MTRAGIAHPLARRSVRGLQLPPILTRYRPGVTERLYTNVHGGAYASYPCPVPVALQAAYVRAIDALDRPRARHPEATAMDPTHVLITAGSIMGIDLLIRVFCEPGEDAICLTTPTFPAYAVTAASLGIDVVDVPLAGPSLDQLDVERIVATGAKLTFLCTPNNPVGTGIDPEQILAIVRRSRGLVVVDEAYIEFARRPSLADVAARYPNLVVLRTLSKAWGLAGLRAGVMIAQPTVLDTVRLVQDPFACTTPVQVEAAARLADLDGARDAMDRAMVDRDAMVVALRDLPAIAQVFASETNFVFCRLAAPPTLLAALAAHPEVLAADASRQVPGCIKISLGTAAENAALLELIARSTTP